MYFASSRVGSAVLFLTNFLVKIQRITARHVTVEYFGDQSLQTYRPLVTSDGKESIDVFKHDELTFYHWFATLVNKVKGDSNTGGRGDRGCRLRGAADRARHRQAIGVIVTECLLTI